jgi:hypothetical protein
MAESNGSGDIIIKGGSVEVRFDSAGYTKNGNNHDNPNKKITQIVVVDENGVEKCNSGDSPNGLKWTVTVSTK